MISLNIIYFFLIAFNLGFEQSSKEQKFKTSVQEIIGGFSAQDSAKISKFISKEIGVYYLGRIGAFDNYYHFKALTFSESTYPRTLFKDTKGIKILPLRYSTLPRWDCEKDVWSKKGLFVDTTKIDHMLSKICKNRNKFVPDNIPNKTIQYFYNLETNSRRVVLNDNDDKELIFYVSYLNGKWYLTIIDNISSDCSV